MNSEVESLLSLLTALVGVIALAMLAQAVAVIIMATKFRKLSTRLESLADQISQDVQPVLYSAREIITESKEKFSAISSNLLDITSRVKGQVTRLDGLVTDASERAQVQIVRIDELVTETIGRVEETTETVRSSILKPVREISAVLTGLRTTLDVLFHRKGAAVDHATQDEELFI